MYLVNRCLLMVRPRKPIRDHKNNTGFFGSFFMRQ